ncbi:hypothetical protein [Maricaulis sp.]|uniref:hypothetical protein n=1 Tax=Maricaulis sp. TaxID=1486257 RepID=UPI003A8D400F
MTFSIDVRPAGHCVVVRLDGPFVLPRIEAACTAIAASADWRPDFDVIFVIGPGTDLNEVTLDSLKDVQDFMRGWNAGHRSGPDPRTAIVCSDDFKRVIADLWLALVGDDWPIQLRIFTSVKEATSWLERPAGTDQA